MTRMVGVLASLALWSLPALAGDFYPATAFFADGLTPGSSWKDILAKPSVVGDFPFVGFGRTLVPMSGLCADATVLRIADPRIDNGVTVTIDSVRPSLHAVAREGRLAAADPAIRTTPADGAVIVKQLGNDPGCRCWIGGTGAAALDFSPNGAPALNSGEGPLNC